MSEGREDRPFDRRDEEGAWLAGHEGCAVETRPALKKKPPAFCETDSHRTPPGGYLVSKSHIILNNQQTPFQFANKRFIYPQSAGCSAIPLSRTQHAAVSQYIAE
jgi:hypothetical protein